MADSRWDRLASLAGVAFVLMVVAGLVITKAAGDSPADGATSEEMLAYYTNDSASAGIGAYLWALSAVPFLWFLASLRGTLRAVEGPSGRLSTAALAGGIAGIALLVVSAACQFAAIDGAVDDVLSAEAAQALFALGTWAFVVAFFFMGVMTGATAIVALRTRLVPKWIAWTGLVIAVGLLTPAVFFVLFLFLVWIVVLSVALYRRGGAPEPVAAETPSTPT
jgi:hypothetical protein